MRKQHYAEHDVKNNLHMCCRCCELSIGVKKQTESDLKGSLEETLWICLEKVKARTVQRAEGGGTLRENMDCASEPFSYSDASGPSNRYQRVGRRSRGVFRMFLGWFFSHVSS